MKTSSVSAASRRSPGSLPRLLSMISLLPALGSCVELSPVAPPAAAFSTLSIALSFAWYYAGTTTLATIPLVVEEVSEGVQEVVRGAVVGSSGVVRCISYGIIMIAALALFGAYRSDYPYDTELLPRELEQPA